MFIASERTIYHKIRDKLLSELYDLLDYKTFKKEYDLKGMSINVNDLYIVRFHHKNKQMFIDLAYDSKKDEMTEHFQYSKDSPQKKIDKRFLNRLKKWFKLVATYPNMIRKYDYVQRELQEYCYTVLRLNLFHNPFYRLRGVEGTIIREIYKCLSCQYLNINTSIITFEGNWHIIKLVGNRSEEKITIYALHQKKSTEEWISFKDKTCIAFINDVLGNFMDLLDINFKSV